MLTCSSRGPLVAVSGGSYDGASAVPSYDRPESHLPIGFKLFLGCLPASSTEEDLRRAFEPYGHIVDIVVLKDKFTRASKGTCNDRARGCEASLPTCARVADVISFRAVGALPPGAGCGFVVFRDQCSADRAIEELHDQFVLPDSTRALIVRYAGRRPDDSQDCASTCEKQRRMLGLRGRALTSLLSSPLLSADNKLYVSMLSTQTTEDELYARFAQFGPISEVVILREKDDVGTSKGCAFVKFLTNEAAQAAILALDKQVRDKVRPRYKQRFFRNVVLMRIADRCLFFPCCPAIGPADERPVRSHARREDAVPASQRQQVSVPAL